MKISAISLVCCVEVWTWTRLRLHAWKIMRFACCGLWHTLPQAAAQASPFCLCSCTKLYLWRVKIAPIGTRTRIISLESGALPACPFPAGTLIVRVCRAVYLFVHCAHFIALSNPFHYISKDLHLSNTIRIVTYCSILVFNDMYCDIITGDIFNWRYFFREFIFGIINYMQLSAEPPTYNL